MNSFNVTNILYQMREQGVVSELNKEELTFFTYCMEHMQKSLAQNFQDLWVLFEMSGAARKIEDVEEFVPTGYFVDFGATDGVSSNNTKILEDAGWHGIVCEPNPVWHPKLVENRKCDIDFRCVAPKSDETVNFICTEEAELSTMSDYVSSDYHFAKRRYNTIVRHIKTVSLNDLIERYASNVPVIDYLSMDTEGSEYDILKSFDFSARPVKLITVEHNHNQGARDDIFQLLSDNGYERKFMNFSRWDDFYKLKENR